MEQVRVGVGARAAAINAHTGIGSVVSVFTIGASGLATTRILICKHKFSKGRVAHCHAGALERLPEKVVGSWTSHLTQVVDIIFELAIPTRCLAGVVIGRSVFTIRTGCNASMILRV